MNQPQWEDNANHNGEGYGGVVHTVTPYIPPRQQSPEIDKAMLAPFKGACNFLFTNCALTSDGFRVQCILLGKAGSRGNTGSEAACSCEAPFIYRPTFPVARTRCERYSRAQQAAGSIGLDTTRAATDACCECSAIIPEAVDPFPFCETTKSGFAASCACGSQPSCAPFDLV